ncbi:MAG: tetratricopeptide repeat protein, partial [Elusimicrobia bacterium]|nr:tetratricopeptide repeat protein [Elusimicrobiota bacterium]
MWLDRARLLLSEALYQGKDDTLAATYLTQALSADLPSDLKAWAFQRLASIRFRQKDYPAVEVALKDLLAQFPKHSSAAEWRYFYDSLPAHAKAWEEVLREARRTARRHLWGLIPFARAERTPTARQEASFRVLWAHLSLQHHKQVAKLSSQFLRRYPTSPLNGHVALARGISQEALGQHEASLQSFRSVLDYASSPPPTPSSPPPTPSGGATSTALYLMALMHQTEDRSAYLVTALNRVFNEATPTLTEQSPLLHKQTAFWIAEAYVRLGDYAHAEHAYHRFLAVSPIGPLAPYALQGLSLSLAQLNRVEEARGVQQQAIALAEEQKNQEVVLNGRFQLAKMAFNLRDYEQAASAFEQVAARAPSPAMKAEALYYGGLSLAGLKYYSEAIKKWDQLVQEYPDAPLRLVAYQQIGKTAFGLTHYDQAEQAYQAITNADPFSPEAQEALFQLVQSAYNKGDIPGAVLQWRAFRLRFPVDPRVRTAAEMLLASTEGQGLPAVDLKLLLAEAPHSSAASSVLWRRGAEAFNAKDYRMAEQWFRDLLVKFPVGAHAPEAYFYLGESLFNQKSFNEAAQAYRHFATQYVTHPLAAQATFQLATSLFQQQDYFAAAEAFGQFRKSFPSHGLMQDALLNEALAYKKAFHPDEAIHAYREFLSRFPTDAKAITAILTLANLYELKGQFVEAASTYSRVPSTAPEYIEARYRVGECYRNLKETAKARTAYEGLLRLEPKDHEFRIAGLLRLAQLYEQAEEPTARILAVYEEIAQSSRNQDIVMLVQQRIKAYKEPAQVKPPRHVEAVERRSFLDTEPGPGRRDEQDREVGGDAGESREEIPPL